MSKSNNGYAVYNELLAHGPLTKAELSVATGLSHGQVESGLNQIREVLAGQYVEPIVYQPHVVAGKQHTYDLAKSEKQAVAYLVYRLGLLKKWLHNLKIGTAAPAAVKFASPSIDVIQFSMEQMESQIEFAQRQLAKL